MGEVQHILTAAHFTPLNMEPVFLRTDELKEIDQNTQSRRELAGKFIGCRAVNVFYGDSTRTRISFEMAEVALGVSYSTTANAKLFSSVAKGETLEHTTGVLSEYRPDFIVLRHDKVNGARRAAAVSKVPIINAGNGGGEERDELGNLPEHPTQAVLDAYTIKERLGRLDNLNISIMGDLRNGRTVRSLIYVLSKAKGNRFTFISPPHLSLSNDIREYLSGMPEVMFEEHNETTVLPEALAQTDVLYVTRTQTNFGAEQTDSTEFRITKELADLMPEHSVILHPMPIYRSRSRPLATEIEPAVDKHPRAYYGQQAGNGMYVRMAIIEAILEGRPVIDPSS